MPPQTKMKFAFTLAEVLITLGIIGVVAAITIPVLAAKIQKHQIETQAKAAYSTIAQVMRFSDYDEVPSMPVSVDITSIKSWFDNFFLPHLKVENICFQQPGCWHKKGVVKTLNHLTPNYETNVGINDSTIGWVAVTFRTAKGVYFDIDASSPTSVSSTFGVDVKTTALQFYFDVNGDRKPNVIGKDIYIMVYEQDIKLVPAGFSRTKEEVEQNCLEGDGYWCLAKLINDGWKIDDRVWKR